MWHHLDMNSTNQNCLCYVFNAAVALVISRSELNKNHYEHESFARESPNDSQMSAACARIRFQTLPTRKTIKNPRLKLHCI